MSVNEANCTSVFVWTVGRFEPNMLIKVLIILFFCSQCKFAHYSSKQNDFPQAVVTVVQHIQCFAVILKHN